MPAVGKALRELDQDGHGFTAPCHDPTDGSADCQDDRPAKILPDGLLACMATERVDERKYLKNQETADTSRAARPDCRSGLTTATDGRFFSVSQGVFHLLPGRVWFTERDVTVLVLDW